MDLGEWVSVATVVAALVAVTVLIITVVVQRRTGRQIVEQARRSADSAALSAAAADRSSKAAEEAVGVNRETAAGVAQRVETDALANRYQDAATQLGHDSAAVRLAGVYAMARLADDWPEQRQPCVDVLCAYLRMSTQHETIQAAEGEKHVRIAVLTLIGIHLDAGRSINWCDCTFDFSYAELPMLDWSQPTFKTRPEFRHVRFADFVSMTSPRFEQGADFSFGIFDGPVRIQKAHITSGDVAFYGADLRTGELSTDFLAPGSAVDLSKSICRGDFAVVCSPTGDQPQGRVRLREVLVKPRGAFSLDGVDLEDTEGASVSGVTSEPRAVVSLEPEGRVRLPTTFKEFSGKGVYNDVWKTD